LKPNERGPHEDPDHQRETEQDHLRDIDAEHIDDSKDVELVEELAHVVHGCEDCHVDSADALVCVLEQDPEGRHELHFVDQLTDQGHHCHVRSRIKRDLVFGWEGAQEDEHAVGAHDDASQQIERLDRERFARSEVSRETCKDNVQRCAHKCDHAEGLLREAQIVREVDLRHIGVDC